MEAFIPSKAYQVLYDFEGTNDRELTVTSGEILLAQEKTSEDDWLFVVKLKNSTKKGFVPAGFISELSASETTRYISTWNTDSLPNPSSPSMNRLNSTTSSTTRAYPNNLLSSVSDQKHTPPSSPTPLHSSNNNITNPLSLSALHSPTNRASSPSRLEDRFSSKRPTTPTSSTNTSSTTNKSSPKVSSSSSSSAGPTGNAQSSVMEMFAKHEAYLRQVMKQREEKFKELEKSISSTGKEIEKYKDLNDTLFQKILKLENALDSEHGKLKQKILEEEKRVASPAFAQ